MSADFDVNSRPLPRPTALTQPFWDACRRGELLVQECSRCRKRFFTPTVACPSCFSAEWQWASSAGTGTIYTFTVVRRPATPAFEVPYVLAVVDLDDGWSMLTNIVESPPETIEIGLRVRVRFVPVSPDISLPCFVPLIDRVKISAI